MTNRTNYEKIGLFVTLGIATAAAIAIAVGVIKLHRKTIAYVTYFNEAVTGVDVGAPVKARGVKVGQVADITFAPDRRMVEVRMDMDEKALERLGVAQPRYAISPDLRAQLTSQGLTGSTIVSIDFFDPDKNPPPVLSFKPAERYIPAAPSQLKTFADSVTKAMDGLANLVDTMSREGFSERTVRAMTTANDVLTSLERFVDDLDRQNIPHQAKTVIEELGLAVNKINSVLDRVDGETGLVATTQRSIGSFGEVGRNAAGATRDLGQTLGEIREAAAAIRLLADELEREPDALLKGRSKESSP